MNTRLIALTSGALLTAAALAGCTAVSSGSNSGMGNMPGMNHGSSSTDSATSDHNQADVTFAMDMVVHHQRVIALATTEAQNGQASGAVTLAKKVATAQTTEIATMKQLLSSL